MRAGAIPRLLLTLGLTALASGCVHAYQPLSGLHRPVVVDPQAANFPGMHLTVVCTPGSFVSPSEAQLLCSRVAKLFEIQGATVTTDGGRTRADEDPEAAPPPPVETDLRLELAAHEVHRSHDGLSWILCFASGTLVPAVTESTFAQEVVIRDGTGFLLVSDRLEGRIVRTFGLGTWVGNKILDLVSRKKQDEMNDKAVHADLSADLYRQLSQDVFNARMRWEVLQEATPAGRATTSAP